MFSTLTAAIALIISILSPVPAQSPEYSATVPDVPAIMFVPEIQNDDYFNAYDIFRVSEDGDMFMVGTNGLIQSDINWLVMNGDFPAGYYILDIDGALIPISAENITENISII